MDDFESSALLNKCTVMGKVRLANAMTAITSRARPLFSSSATDEPGASSPTKELDALVLGNTLVGYGDTISLENMMIIENIINFSKSEADREAGGSHNPAAWHRAFLQCMEDMGCFVPVSASVEYSKVTGSGEMKNVVTNIVKAGVAAAKAAVPGATVLGAVAESSFSALEKEPEIIKVFNFEVTKSKGVKLAVIPCDQAKNGLIIVSCSSIHCEGGKVSGEALFLDVKIENLDIYQGSNFLTFNPVAYAEIKEDIEQALGANRAHVRAKRFSRNKRPR